MDDHRASRRERRQRIPNVPRGTLGTMVAIYEDQIKAPCIAAEKLIAPHPHQPRCIAPGIRIHAHLLRATNPRVVRARILNTDFEIGAILPGIREVV